MCAYVLAFHGPLVKSISAKVWYRNSLHPGNGHRLLFIPENHMGFLKI